MNACSFLAVEVVESSAVVRRTELMVSGYLLLVLALGEVDANELNVRLDRVPVDLLWVDVLEK